MPPLDLCPTFGNSGGVLELQDTIVACITGPGRSAVAAIRLSGSDAWTIASRLFTPWPSFPVPRHAYYGRFKNNDDGLLILFESLRSYTREATAELFIHGSPASVRSLIEETIAHGARLAEPGEFTRRAFLHGRLDLTQAEAVRDTIEAETEAQLRNAFRNLDGALTKAFHSIREGAVAILAEIEAHVDFSEDLPPLDRIQMAGKVVDQRLRVDSLLGTANQGEILRSGFRVAILGRPNAGKSTLLNTLLGRSRAIVSETPGTTRDFLEERIDVAGLPVVLIDTAGLRASNDPIEAEGIDRSRAESQHALLRLYLFESWTPEDDAEWQALPSPKLKVRTKVDLATSTASGEDLAVSCMTGEGIEELNQALLRVADLTDTATILPRHQPILRAVRDHLNEAEQSLRGTRPLDLASVSLQAAVHELGKLIGETATADILDEVFGTFCLGK